MSAPPADLPADWPHRDASAEVASAPHRWHVQSFGAGPDVWMLHGAGASAHSFRALGPRIAQAGWRVSVPDLPGHGFTRMGQPRRSGLRPMAEDLARLMATLDRPPVALIGHSAGGALALELVRLLGPGPRAVVTLNAALGHFRGVAGWLFPMLARLLALSPLVPPVFARSTGQAQVARLLAGTGSEVDAEGVALYARLIARPDHVSGALGMMAQWRLDPLLAALGEVRLPVLMLAGARDRAVPPEVSQAAARRLPQAECTTLAGLGHLMHEEAPEAVARLILPFLERHAR
ncbi:MAG: alpha/beta fold hydrolase BchO [Gemmobacter sp.]|jgi:magnesium chelatase accessory protein